MTLNMKLWLCDTFINHDKIMKMTSKYRIEYLCVYSQPLQDDYKMRSQYTSWDKPVLILVQNPHILGLF